MFRRFLRHKIIRDKDLLLTFPKPPLFPRLLPRTSVGNVKARNSCSNCRRLQTRVAALEATVARLQEQLAAARKDSATSSKPPSSDIVKPPKPPPPEGQDRRKIAGC